MDCGSRNISEFLKASLLHGWNEQQISSAFLSFLICSLPLRHEAQQLSYHSRRQKAAYLKIWPEGLNRVMFRASSDIKCSFYPHISGKCPDLSSFRYYFRSGKCKIFSMVPNKLRFTEQVPDTLFLSWNYYFSYIYHHILSIIQYEHFDLSYSCK